MALYDELQQALIAADKAGHTQDVQTLMSELDRLKTNVKSMSARYEQPEPPPNPTEGMSNFDLARAGVGRAMADTARGAGQLVGAVSRKDVADARIRDEPLGHTLPGMLGDIGGTAGMALAPGGLLKSAGMVAQAPRIAAIGDALMVPRGAAQIGAVGAGTGLLQPSTSTQETLTNMGLGVGGQALAPVIGRGLSMAKSAAEPFYREGQNQILARLLQKTAGGEAPEVAARLHGAFEPFVGPTPEGEAARGVMGELVPGSVPTLGQAAQNPGIGALERSVAQTDPAASLAITQRLKAQNEARAKILEDMGGTQGARDFHDAARSSTANQLYGDAFKDGIDPALMTSGRKGEITKLMNTPAMQQAAEDAKKLASNEMLKLDDPTGSVQGMHYMRQALTDSLADAKPNEKRILMGLRDRLDTTLDTLSPKYGEARRQFAAMSAPINEMDTAQAIAKKATNPLTDQVQGAAYARALSDDTAKSATGFKGATLEGTMQPRNLAKLEAIKDDLARAKAAENVGRGPGSDTIQKLAYSNMVDAAGVPNFIRSMKIPQIAGNLAGRGADALYGQANKTMSARLAEILANPEEASKLLLQQVNQQPSRTAEALRRIGAGAGLALPGSVNALQQ